jgi:hypothetical protein
MVPAHTITGKFGGGGNDVKRIYRLNGNMPSQEEQHESPNFELLKSHRVKVKM